MSWAEFWHGRKLKKLHRKEVILFDAYRDAVRRLMNSGNVREMNDTSARYARDRARLDDDIAEVATFHLVDEAHSLMVPLPYTIPGQGKPDTWRKAKNADLMLLTPEGITELREAIHEERKRRSERGAFWLTPAVSVFSLIVSFGSLVVAIVALLQRKN
jgi:hypothetical protein